MLVALAFLAVAAGPVPPGEEPVDPYVASNANAGAGPFAGQGMWAAFHSREGVARVVDAFVARNQADPRIADIFRGQDMVRLRRTLKEQFCYILNGGCDYSGRTMAEAHKNLGTQTADFNALVENLQWAMDREKIAFAAQSRFLAKLAPMKRETVVR